MKNILHRSYGLFNVSFWRHPIIWLKDLRIYFYRTRFLLKHGYAEPFRWEYAECLAEVSKQVFTYLLRHRKGDMLLTDDMDLLEAFNDMFYNDLLIDLSYMQNEEYPFEDRETAKEDFFKQICEHYWELWD